MAELEDNEPSVKDLLANINETLEALLIVNMRLYDVAMFKITGEHVGPEDSMLEAHRAGRVLGPMPSYSTYEEDVNDE